ncbi:hypothetical protein [Mesorhizobium sp. WSM3859]|uniref:DUF6894 family protein n=1 Tax=Mesorhizobium sp. WSM3859 TaxID=2029402 RepID=UPI000BAFCE1C|nr:hypothetical protein [Mesorhizobium sp. WSM3859]PBC09381.1 hypothetical protein CK230_14625 [Mesorhizobium sp. WSM3859]
MPRYFFDFTDNASETPDPEGVDLPDVGEAKNEAIRTLAEILQEILPDGNHREISFCVRDEAGDRLMKLAITFDAQMAKARGVD